MSESTPPPVGGPPATPVLPYGQSENQWTLVRVGGALGIAACCVGLLVFLVGCAGFSAVFALSIIPTALGLAGLVLAVVGGVSNRALGVQDTEVLAALFLGIMGLVGGIMLLAVWRQWMILPPTGVGM